MTPLQECEFDLLKEFISICGQLNLRYYLVCGSALGAAKYQGFIPWDDDVDVAMPRPDYEIFLQKAQELLPEHIFLQNAMTDSEFPLLFSKLRNSKTTYMETGHGKLHMNHGVYIDVFPLDGYPIEQKAVRQFEKRKAYFERRRKVTLDYNRWEHPKALKTNAVYLLYRVFGMYHNTAKTIYKYNAFLSQYDLDTSEVWCNHGNWQGTLEYAPQQQYGNGTKMKFEGLTVCVPERYDDYLTQKYGDWRADLLPEQQVGHHSYAILDLNRSYTHYMRGDTNDGGKK